MEKVDFNDYLTQCMRDAVEGTNLADNLLEREDDPDYWDED